MRTIRWGIVGCGNVTEVKSGPALQKATGSALVAVMRRDRALAEDYARRHGVARVHATAEHLVADPDVDAVYVATPPSSHERLALLAAAARKPCLVEKPMAADHAACLRMVDAFRSGGVPLFVAYYRRAFPRFRKVAALLTEGAVGPITSVHIVHYDRLVSAGEGGWRVVPAEAGAGLLFDLASHGLDLLDFLVGPVVSAAGHATNTGGRYAAEDVTAASFAFASGAVGTGVWNFNADRRHDELIVTGRDATLRVPVFTDGDITVVQDGREQVFPFRNPPHVHQPLVQTIVDELRGEGRCPSTGESGARTSWVLDRLVESYYAARPGLRGGPSQASRSTSGLGRPDSA